MITAITSLETVGNTEKLDNNNRFAVCVTEFR